MLQSLYQPDDGGDDDGDDDGGDDYGDNDGDDKELYLLHFQEQ